MMPSPTLTPGQRVLRDYALTFPESSEHHPWGECVVKVKGRVFVFLGVPQEGLIVCVKLPESGEAALSFPFAEPAGYGLGKSGWVLARFGGRKRPPLGLLKAWIEESYRAVAPKRLLAAREARENGSRKAKSTMRQPRTGVGRIRETPAGRRRVSRRDPRARLEGACT